jgi:pimeloyl-ACP methyl ester carboxylesterase
MKKIFEHDLAAISYEIIGEGLPILHLHGYELDSNCMKYSLESIYRKSKGFMRIYMDLPGMGFSSVKPGLESADEMLDVIQSFIEHNIQSKQVLVVGLPYGGYLSIRLAQTLQNRIMSLLLICPVIKPKFNDRKIPKFRVAYANQKFIQSLTQFEYQGIKDWMVIQTARVYKRYLKEIVPAVERGDRKFLDHYSRYGYGFTEDEANTSIRLTIPVAFICGKEDNVVGYEDAVEISKNFTKGDVHLIAEAGHNLPIEQPGKFTLIIQNWLDSNL